ncbi:hypothetical protein RZN22_18390 [Bacillaceae bacterium S4-13-58]
MKIFDAISFQSLFLIIAGIAIFILLLFLFSEKKKTYRAAMMLSKADIDLKKKKDKGKGKEVVGTNGLDKFLDSTKFLSKYSPYNVLTEAHKIEWMIGYKEYFTHFFLVGGIVSGLVWVAIGQSYFAFYAVILGVFVPRIMLYFKQKKFEITRQERIAIYMKAVSNSMSVFGNAIDAIEEVMPLVHETIRVDLVKTVALLKSGKSLSYSFKEMVDKYDYQELHFFTDMLEAAHEHGGN